MKTKTFLLLICFSSLIFSSMARDVGKLQPPFNQTETISQQQPIVFDFQFISQTTSVVTENIVIVRYNYLAQIPLVLNQTTLWIDPGSTISNLMNNSCINSFIDRKDFFINKNYSPKKTNKLFYSKCIVLTRHVINV